MKTKLFLLLAFITTSCFSQFSKTHYIPPLCNTDEYGTEDQYLYISCPSVTNVNYTIRAIGGATTTGVVRRDNPQTVFIGNGSDTQLLANGTKISTVLNNKGYVVEAEGLVYVTVRLAAALNNAGTPNHAGGLVSKGLAALGTKFRIGAFINTGVSTDRRHNTFAAILATENNTVISFSDIKPGVILQNNAGGSNPANVTLNSGESYIIAATGPTTANADGLIGALISSNKPIAVNCGSFGGSNGDNTNSSDIGFDQIVSAERTGDKYIFIKGENINEIERPLIVAHENNTEVFLNGSAIPTATLNAGQYLALNGSQFSASGNLFVNTSKNVFAYQGIGGTSQANQNMHFLPPLSCETPKVVNNIPFINQIGGLTNFIGTVCIVAETGASLDFIINGNSYTSATLPGGVTLTGPFNVAGNTGYVTYKIRGLTGNVSVISTKSVYVSYYSSSGAATYGGFYSGFVFKPEVSQDVIAVGQTNCIPNATLSISSISSFDAFEWYLNGTLIPGATTNSYTPTQPGYYNVKGTITACNTSIFSERIPVSTCPTNIDGDLANDNIDIDNDNDGITNCIESFGNQPINTAVVSGTVPQSATTYTAIVTTSITPALTPFVGNIDGSFVTELLAGKTNTNSYEVLFSQPTNVSLEYVTTANASDLLNSNAEYIVNSNINKTITLLNPTNQLLIDTNYDGIYESGVTTYSSFEIRFRLNSAIPLAAGTGTFKFLSFQTDSFKITHKNLSDLTANKSTFKLIATCVYKNSDSDAFPDQLDSDSDNDTIPDTVEAQVTFPLVLLNTDTNLNGLDNAFEPGLTPLDTDADLVPDYLDLDSDNDGILDSTEGITDTDADGIKNYRELDSDNDLCSDVLEAGFLDANNDGILGATSPPTINTTGQVTSGVGYTAPNGNYVIAAPIVITTQPTIAPTCDLQNVSVTLADNGGNTYQWQLSTDGVTWNNIANAGVYSGSTTNTLTLTTVTNAMNGYKYRVILNKIGNSCGLISADASLTVFVLPVVNNVTLIECDTDLDLLTTFNLTLKNSAILSPLPITTEVFTYYSTPTGAANATVGDLISNFGAFPNTASPMNVWARVVNSNGCFRVAQITLVVSASNIPQSFSYALTPVCDDTLNIIGTPASTVAIANINKRDGTTVFDLTPGITAVKALLPPPLTNYTFKYYRNGADALAQVNITTGASLEIPAIELTNFRNNASELDVWVRVINTLGGCSGFGPFIKLNVEKLPFANPVPIFRQCDDNQDGIFNFITSSLETTLLGTNQTFPITITYFDNVTGLPLTDSNGIAISSPFPATFLTTSKIIKAVVTNNTTQACFDEKLIEFKIDKLPTATLPTTNPRILCDDEVYPIAQDGIVEFNTTLLENEVKGSQTDVIITYFDSAGLPLVNALGIPIVSPFPATFKTTSKIITATVTSTIAGTTCASVSVSIPFVVNKVPAINNLGEELVCSNDPTFTVNLDAGITNGIPTTDYTYVWNLNGTPIVPAQTGYGLTVFTPGIYTVAVSLANNTNPLVCNRTRTITVTASNTALFNPTTIVELSENNTVTINVSGDGDYAYSLDEENGPFQESNVFTNVLSGIHIVYVKDLNGCKMAQKEIYVLGTPKYFTPNGDGINDTWNVQGVTSLYNAKTIIYIFDRFGKLVKEISPLGQGWDGNFNGEKLPATDYWFNVQFEDGRNIKGNFSLKR